MKGQLKKVQEKEGEGHGLSPPSPSRSSLHPPASSAPFQSGARHIIGTYAAAEYFRANSFYFYGKNKDSHLHHELWASLYVAERCKGAGPRSVFAMQTPPPILVAEGGWDFCCPTVVLLLSYWKAAGLLPELQAACFHRPGSPPAQDIAALGDEHHTAASILCMQPLDQPSWGNRSILLSKQPG